MHVAARPVKMLSPIYAAMMYTIILRRSLQ